MILDETGSSLRFQFSDDAWHNVIKYDSEKESPQIDYDKIKNAIEQTKAVDFIGIYQKDELTFFEVKNFKFYRIDSRDRIEKGDDKNEPLDIEIAKKVRDTLAGIIGGARNSTHQRHIWKDYLRIFSNENKRIRIVLWLEQDRPNDRERKPRTITFQNKLLERLSWLTSDIRVFCINNHDFKDNLIVENLPRTKD